jgi:hypothetical protein
MLGQVVLHNDGTWIDTSIGADIWFAVDADTGVGFHESKSPLKFMLDILIWCSCICIVRYPFCTTFTRKDRLAGQGWRVMAMPHQWTKTVL